MAEYSQKEVALSLSLLLELMDALKGYGADVIVVGGWAPHFVLKDFSKGGVQHVGSLDADLVLNCDHIPETAYETILETLQSIGYQPRKNAAGKPIPASFEKKVQAGGTQFRMQVDFLAGEYGGTGKSHRHQRVQDLLAHKARGADIVFDQFYTAEIAGRLPNGATVKVRANIANEVAVFVMKGICIAQRTKAKDYYDLYMLAKHFKSGPKSIAESLAPHIQNGLVKEALVNVRRYFNAPDGHGPTSVADFLGEGDPAEREIRQRDVYETLSSVTEYLNSLGTPAQRGS
jgi:hypothetical protein